MKCLICKIAEADKTGSHIIPHFIIGSIVNSNASKGRDKEQSFQISDSGSDFFFGRSVSPEILEDLFGKPIDENDIQHNSHHYVRDYIFCSSCETKLSFLESLYQREIAKSTGSHRRLTDEQIKIFKYFWLSIILRCSVTRFGDFQLTKALEDKVSSSINTILASSEKVLHQNCVSEPFIFRLISFANHTAENKTGNSVVLVPSDKSPYVLIVNEELLIFNYSDLSEVSHILSAIGLSPSNNLADGTLTYLSDDDWGKVVRYCFKIIVEQFKQFQIVRFSEEFFSKNSYPPPTSTVNEFMAELIFDETISEVFKYSEERIQNLIKKYI